MSVEMIEAVGHEYWSTYFSTIDRVLAPGGRVGIQAITMPHDRMLATRNSHTWINKYIFPGGFLPSVRVIDEITRRDTTLRVTDRLSFGRHYAETLRQWDEAFRAAAERRAGPGLRPDLPADVALLPRVLPRRLRLRLPRRAAAHADPAGAGVTGLPAEFLTVTGLSLLVAVAAMTVTALVARRLGRVSVVDVTWGLGLVLVALVCAVLGSVWDAGWVPWLLVVLVGAWGLRLSWHIFRRSRGHGEDPRYAAILGVSPADDRAAWFSAAVRKVFVIQAAALFFVSWPLQAAPLADVRVRAARGGRRAGVRGRLRLRGGRRRPARGVQARPRPRPGHGPRPLGVDPPPELLRRRLRVVGDLARRRGRRPAGCRRWSRCRRRSR